MDVKGVFPFDLPPFVLDILLLNKNANFRTLVTWIELAELARRMAHTKDPTVEKLEREAWFRMCAHGSGEVEDHVVQSIFLSEDAGIDWFSAGVQTLLLCSSFQRPTVAFLKGARRQWFPREYRGAEIGLQLLCMGVYCSCENREPRGGVVFVKRQKVDEPLLPPPGKWKAGTMRKAWMEFIVGRYYRDERVLENIRLVQDPELTRRMDEIDNKLV